MPDKKIPRLAIGGNRDARGNPHDSNLRRSDFDASPGVTGEQTQEDESLTPRGVELGRDGESSDAVILPQGERVLGAAIIGKPGTGKSSLLEHLILADLADGTPGMVIDPHGRLVHRIISAATPEQAERIILLEATPHAPFGLNLLALRKPVNDKDDVVTWAVDTVVETVKKLYSEDDVFAPRLERYLRLAARTLIPAGRTLVDIPSLFEDDGFRMWCLDKVTTSLEAQAMRARWAAYERLRPVDRVLQTEALMNRIDGIIDSPLLSSIVGSRKTTVPFDEILSGNATLLVSLPSETLGRDRCDFIGAMLLCELANRVFSRTVAKTTPPRLHLYLDEYQRFATSTTADLLEEGRKYNVAVVLAHQTLYQIANQRIRNASRHAGTLIALGLTRPDAEQLAGEFPFEPRAEWIEVIEEADSFEPKLVFSPTPAEDIFLKGHTDPDLDKIARSLFGLSPRWTKERVMSLVGIDRQNADMLQVLGDERKTAGVEPRPDGMNVDPRVKIAAYDANELFSDAMAGKLVDKEALLEKLLWAETWVPTVRMGLPEDPNFGFRAVRLRDPGTVSTMYFELSNASPSIIQEGTCDCHLRIDDKARGHERYTIGRFRPRRPDDPLGLHLVSCTVRPLTDEQKAHNEEVQTLYRAWAEYLVNEEVRSWLRAHLNDLDALWASKYTSSFQAADRQLMSNAWINRWDGDWKWHGPVIAAPGGALEVDVYEQKDMKSELYDKRLEEFLMMCEVARWRIRWLTQLSDGLYREPVMVPSGEQQPRQRTIVHPAQTQQDALNEFAAELVNPPEQYLAHVRMPQRYHRTKLNAPVRGEVNVGRIVAVRERSQELYRIPDDHSGGGVGGAPPPAAGTGPGLRRIGRRPRSQDPAQQTLPYPIDPEG